jgi:hypothetical protein
MKKKVRSIQELAFEGIWLDTAEGQNVPTPSKPTQEPTATIQTVETIEVQAVELAPIQEYYVVPSQSPSIDLLPVLQAADKIVGLTFDVTFKTFKVGGMIIYHTTFIALKVIKFFLEGILSVLGGVLSSSEDSTPKGVQRVEPNGFDSQQVNTFNNFGNGNITVNQQNNFYNGNNN